MQVISSVFFRSLNITRHCQQENVDSKTLLEQNPRVLDLGWWLADVDMLNNDHTMVVCVSVCM